MPGAGVGGGGSVSIHARVGIRVIGSGSIANDVGSRRAPNQIGAVHIEKTRQSSGPGGALVSLVGVREARAFRDRVLEQRDKVTENRRDDVSFAPSAPDESAPILVEIRDALLRIESKLDER